MLFVKPCKQAEIDFYQSTVDHLDFKYYIPIFYGELSLNQEATAAVATSDVTVEPRDVLLEASASSKLGQANSDTWTPSNGAAINADVAIVLENVAYGFNKPCILDVKLGSRLWGNDAPPAKRQRLDEAAAKTTSKLLGFRIAGMKVWAGNTTGDVNVDANGYKSYGKEYGRGFKQDTVHEGFEEFFVVESAGITRKLARRIIKRFLADLRALREVLEKEESRMYSASLLFIYEGDGATLTNKFEEEKLYLEAHRSGIEVEEDDANVDDPADSTDVPDDDVSSMSDEGPQLPKIQILKMIDFAHAEWVPGQGPDENVLHGIRSVINTLEALIA